MPSNLISEAAARVLGPRQTRLLGRGASALWVALEAIAERDGWRGEVILPDVICVTVLETVLAAGYTPRFADVDPQTLTLTGETVARCVSGQTHAVVVAHLFGHAAPVTTIAALLPSRARLIEDAVQGLGGQAAGGKAIGSLGDFAFVSFDRTKMVRGRGGILAFDDPTWEGFADKAAARMPVIEDSPDVQLLCLAQRDLYHGLGAALRLGRLSSEIAAASFRGALASYVPLLFRRFDDTPGNVERIMRDLTDLHVRVAARNRKAAALRDALHGLGVETAPIGNGDAIWRYNVRFPTAAVSDRFVLALRRRGGLVSHLYYPLNQLFAPDQGLPTPSTMRAVVNLFVDEAVDERYPDLVRQAAEEAVGLRKETA